MKKLGIITSKGGHLFEIIHLYPLIKKSNHFWVTYPGKDSEYLLKKEVVYYAHYPESRNWINSWKNIWRAMVIFMKEKPTVLISCGAGIAVPFFVIGKLFFRTRVIFIESYTFTRSQSLTGKVLYQFVDLFLVQHQFQKKWYPNAQYWGSLI